MQEQIDEIILHMAKSQEELASILEAKRCVVCHLALMNQYIPPVNPEFEGLDALMEHSLSVTKSVTSYLNVLSDLEEAMSGSLECIVRELGDGPGEE
ncbi:hypothetical protein [Paenibacillus mucilaginosus]|uniref:Nucleoside-diphosphate sugar epimerase n=3 Tax=Paenibacillus mucilaginosus TaxID=61624 RepID=H6NR89_9BACL|nr:hypothetical protein [Paenibacillus mucilaginosus]AEI45052.1 conserved hypothetical protein [Paenibacillus mucilaginosus KNP414]AFC32782.1 hypothetical protein PM3016_6139 [Paenibacillus mucilaginosus 3016]AFH65118.1 hypothetical protein B2K_31170 [Paenibacillus mucilaginosus K02]MCG7213045.1 hypothetical protein [Paenibacillus mucilaginosus]WDM26549.1 hypothetical protein KCX80_29645 [Paenibacillus mucilaginosus]